MTEEYFIVYKTPGNQGIYFPISEQQYNFEMDYQLKLVEFNPNQATADYKDEEFPDFFSHMEIISFYDPYDAGFPCLQLIRNEITPKIS